jgi:ribosomal protein S18 acetylase RimI-like enzyme
MTLHSFHMADKDTVRDYLNRERVYSAYMLGDLDDEHWHHCEFYGAGPAAENSVAGLVLRYTGFSPNLLVLSGEPAPVEALLLSFDRTDPVYVTATDTNYPVFQQFYNTPEARHMWRMAFDTSTDLTQYEGEAVHLQGPADTARVKALFQQAGPEAGIFFTAEQVNGGAFYGIFSDGQLVAVAGTHIVSANESVAAVGNVYTRPAYRGRGFAGQCTAATTRHLVERGIRTIVLNVKQQNSIAIKVYEKLGYARVLPFWEGSAIPRQAS